MRAAIRTRLAQAPGRDERMRRFLAAQQAATARLAPEALEEIAGIAEGFALDPAEVFDFLHLGCLADLAAAPADTDGCSAFAAAGRVAKNRDFRPEHAGLQRVFCHLDPAWGGRRVLCLGSLGAPGAWSSGLNSDGLALADTQIPTADHGPGLLRYFLMTRLLATCATVAQALAAIADLPHAGGGSLVLGDATGAAAAVELRHGRVDVAHGAWVARTNHYTAAPDPLAPVPHSAGRLALLQAALAAESAREPRALLATHAPVALCRHAPDPSPTLAGAVWDCAGRSAVIAAGPPCTADWVGFVPDGMLWREIHASA
ncbi:acyl-CoA:6-aminopenicillanic acid acyl transferase [Humitalea rosea]|uniref:Acyl-CoA:6-aminopenicillanic acid acyl transferase n=1 Tax=Humitalea rosea TaxID=990373 RepID=A0A2W7HY28_9PROT|nr:acyl-CoA:6-aminopenicillanic acid acyl transferase [Humitalea rosea]